MSAKNRFDAILASVPMNGTAGAVTSPGVHYTPVLKDAPHLLHWDAPPKIRAIPNGGGSTQFNDLSGIKFGRFTVVGVWDDAEGAPRNDVKTKWVVRCACGDYEVRSSRAVKNPKNDQDRCRFCRDLEYKKRRYRDLGSRKIEDFTGGSA